MLEEIPREIFQGKPTQSGIKIGTEKPNLHSGGIRAGVQELEDEERFHYANPITFLFVQSECQQVGAVLVVFLQGDLSHVEHRLRSASTA